jgi:hypothetical protein
VYGLPGAKEELHSVRQVFSAAEQQDSVLFRRVCDAEQERRLSAQGHSDAYLQGLPEAVYWPVLWGWLG